jgi:ketosteroid isomerase-like protein
MALDKKAVIAEVNEAFARNDIERVLAHCHEDFIWTMVGSEPVQGKDAVRQWTKQAPSEPPSFTVQTVIGDGDFVSAIGDMTMKENGVVVPYAYCDVWRFRGDKIAELKAFVMKTTAVAT